MIYFVVIRLWLLNHFFLWILVFNKKLLQIAKNVSFTRFFLQFLAYNIVKIFPLELFEAWSGFCWDRYGGRRIYSKILQTWFLFTISWYLENLLMALMSFMLSILWNYRYKILTCLNVGRYGWCIRWVIGTLICSRSLFRFLFFFKFLLKIKIITIEKVLNGISTK